MDNTQGDFLEFPKNFRSEEFTRLFRIISRGESTLISSPSGTGKSTLLRLLIENKEIKNLHAPDLEIKFAYLNCEQFVGKNSLEAENYLSKQVTSEFLTQFLTTSDKRVVIIIDHAENILDGDFSGFFSLLRLLREVKRDKVSLLFACSRPIDQNVDLPKFGYLKPVILENQISLSPLNQKDTEIFLDRLEKILETTFDKKIREKIYTLSGGTMRIAKRLAKLVADGESLEKIENDPSCDMKLKSDLDTINDFFIKYPSSKFLLPLLDNQNQKAVVEQIDTVKFSQLLTRQEHDLAALLISKNAQIVSREEMIEAVWKNKQYDVNEHALDQMLHRLRLKLSTADPKCDLQTLRGRGCSLKITA